MRRLVLFAILSACAGCARGPNVGSRDLPLRRVVVYRNGVGYFERAGRIDEERVSFEMRQRMVGDFLASLAVIERGGSSVRSASFPLEIEETDKPAPDEPPPTPKPRIASDMPSPPTPPVPSEKKPDPQRMREVVLHLDGKEHDLAIGYLSETPLWRPSYRVVVGSGGSADLQAWGIVQNLSGEDWKDVTLSLVAGAPLAFQSTLGTPVVPERPVVTDQGEVVAVVPTGVTSLDRSAQAAGVDRYAPEDSPAPAAEAVPAEAPEKDDAEEEGRVADKKYEQGRARRASMPASKKATGGVAGNVAPAPPPAPARYQSPAPTLSAPRRLSALAAVALEAGTTRYDIPYPVTVPNDSATMVMLTSQRVQGEAVLLFGPESGVPDSEIHPFRVVRFTNSTTGLLERGPITVFEQSSFLGQGMLEPLPPRATATVPFALDRSVALARKREQDERGARLFRIEAGRLWIDRDVVMRTTYTIDNGGEQPVKVLVKHPRTAETRLFKPPPGTEDNTGSGNALIPTPVRAHGKSELVVDERRSRQDEADWLAPPADEAVRGYLADSRRNPELARRLTEVWTVREDLRHTIDELEKLTNEQNELERASEESRRNLKAIEKNPQAADLRQKLTRRLSEASTRLDAISKRAIELRMALDERRVRFREATNDLKLDAPLPVKD
jgi:hypothetical protein